MQPDNLPIPPPRPTPPLPWFQAYNKRARQAVVSIVCGLAFLALGLIYAAKLSSGRESALGILTFAPLVLTFVAITLHTGLFSWRRTYDGIQNLHLRSDTPSRATLLPYTRLTAILFYAVTISVIIPLLLIPHLLEASTPEQTTRAVWIRLAAPIMPIFAIGPTAILFSRLIRKRSQLGLGLSPEGIYRWSWLGCRFVSWSWISRIEPRRDSAPLAHLIVSEPKERLHNPEENFLTRRDLFRKRDDVFAALLTVHPTVAYYALHYYLRHPEKRDELGTDAALERMRTLDFPDIIAEIKRYGDVRPR